MTKAEIESMKEIRNDYTKTLDEMKRERKALLTKRRAQSEAIYEAEQKRIKEFNQMISNITEDTPKTAREISAMTNGDFSSHSVAGYGAWATYCANPDGHRSIYRWARASLPGFRSKIRTSLRHTVEIDINGNIIPGSDKFILQKRRVYYTTK